jgi:outer membrane protein assembly factor BamB
VWKRDFAEEYKSRFAAQGTCNMSPLVASGRVIVPTGAREGVRIAAFDAASGKPAWTAANVPNSLTGAPGLMDAGGAFRVLYHHAKPPGTSGISAIDVQSGAVAWQFDGKASMSDTTPVALPGNRVLIQTWANSSMYDTSASPRELWTNDELSAAGSPPVVHGEYLYGFGGNSTEFLKCVEAATGKVRWSNRIYRGFAALAGDTLVVIGEASGLLRLIGADPASYRELSRLQVLEAGARTGTPPAIAGGRIYVRNLEQVVAIDAR